MLPSLNIGTRPGSRTQRRKKKRFQEPFFARKSAGQAGSGDAEKGSWNLFFATKSAGQTGPGDAGKGPWDLLL